MRYLIMILVSLFLMIGCGGRQSPKQENPQKNRKEIRLNEEKNLPAPSLGNDNFRIEYFKNNGNVRFYDSKGVEKLTCNTNPDGIPFSLKPIVWENMGKIEYSSISVNFDGDIKPDLITFLAADGEKLKCRIVLKNVSLLSEGKSVSKITYNIDLKPNTPQNKTDSLLNFLSTRQIDKITLEDTRERKSTVQGVSNSKFFLEFFMSLEKFRINKE